MNALPPRDPHPAVTGAMQRRTSRRFRTVAGLAVGTASAAAALVAFTVDHADAHHADVSVVCVAAPAKIRITATAWDAPTPDGRVNNAIVITFDDQVIATGTFNAANNYSFTVDYDAPPSATGSHTVRAAATRAWGPNETIPDIGGPREATVDLPCGPAATTTTAVATTTTKTTTTTTAPPEVLGVTETRAPDTAVPIEVLPRFAG